MPLGAVISLGQGKAWKALKGIFTKYYLCLLMSLRKGWELAGGPQVKCEVGLAYCYLQSEEGAHISTGDEEGMVPP